MKSRFLIYLLVDPRTDEVRYVGKSTTGECRPREHVMPSRMAKDANTYKGRWIKSLLVINMKPIILIREYQAEDDLGQIEKHWIESARAWGCRLTNLTNGGEGTSGFKHSEETRRRMSINTLGHAPTKGFSGHRHSAESKAKTSATLRVDPNRRGRILSAAFIEAMHKSRLGTKASFETRAKMSATRRGKKHPISVEARAKITAALTGKKRKPLSAEHRAKISQALTGLKRSEETIARMSAIGKKRGAPILSPEQRAIIAAKLKGRRPSPQAIAASIVAHTGRKPSLESRAKMSVSQKGRKHTPETRAKIAATHTGMKHTLETRAKLSIIKKAFADKLRSL